MKPTHLTLAAARITVRDSEEHYVVGKRVLSMKPVITPGQVYESSIGYGKAADTFQHWDLGLELYRSDLYLYEVLTRAGDGVTIEGWIPPEQFGQSDYPWLYCVIARATFAELDPWDFDQWRSEDPAHGQIDLPGRTWQLAGYDRAFAKPADVHIPWDFDPVTNWAFTKCESGPPATVAADLSAA